MRGKIAERPRGGANHVRVDDEMRNCLNDIINENCLRTLAQIYQELRQRLPRKPTFHDCTVARTLEVMLYRVKLARPLPADRNGPDVLQKRVDYTNWFMRHAVANHSIFVDECGYNIWTARSHGRARLGERAYRQVCGQQGRNVTVALAISTTNTYRTARFIGTITAAKCGQWYRLMQTYIPRCLKIVKKLKDN